jgi:hypothetical protein
MSTFRNPVGPQPAKVYWRRRLIVGLGALAVILIIILIFSRLGAGGAPTPVPSNSKTPVAGTDPSGNPVNAGADKACDPTKVVVTPATDANSYAAGVNPVLTFSLKSTETCILSAGSDVQEFRVTSGDELIWSSKDCQTDQLAAEIQLKQGVPFPGSSLTWDRTRSSTDTCDTARDQVIAGGASYHLEVIVDGIKSPDTKQFILE